MSKFPRTIRLDPSDTFVFERAAEPGEWAVSGAFVFWTQDPALLSPKARVALRSGFLGIDSLGWAHFRLGHYAEAVAELERATGLSPADAEIIDHLGDAYWRVGREAEARYQWTAALRLAPGPEREQTLRGKLEKGLPAKPSASLASRP